MHSQKKIKKRIRRWIILFILGLTVSGLTAFPIESQLSFLVNNPQLTPSFITNWVKTVYTGIVDINERYPFISYGTDWLAFAHIVIAIAFIGPLKDPVRNIWVIQFGMIACVLVVPLALIAGYIREIPFYWRLIDCSFGVFGIIPLYFCYRDIKKLEKELQFNQMPTT